MIQSPMLRTVETDGETTKSTVAEKKVEKKAASALNTLAWNSMMGPRFYFVGFVDLR